MTKSRKIAAAVAIAVAVTMSAAVCAQWYTQGCGVWSLVVGVTYYASITAAIWKVIDSKLKEE